MNLLISTLRFVAAPPNALTALRALIVLPTVWSILTEKWWLAALLFTVAVISDIADGKVARKLDLTTPAGGVFDHVTDALYVSANLAACAWLNLSPWWLPLLIVAAFVQYLFDSNVLRGAALRGSWLGRYNGIAYFVLLGLVIGRELFAGWPSVQPLFALGVVLSLTTVLSMVIRLHHWRRLSLARRKSRTRPS